MTSRADKAPTLKREKLAITSRSYSKVADQPVFITPGLKAKLEKSKGRDGATLYNRLTTMGFRGGKHLIEMVRKDRGSAFEIVLSEGPCALDSSCVIVDFERFREVGQKRFFDVYRQTGIETALSFLEEQFPAKFASAQDAPLPERKTVRRVLENLSEAIDAIPKKDKAQIPTAIAELVERQGTEFVFELLSSVDAAIPKGQERIKVAFKEVIERLAREPAKALQELSDLMDDLNLLQVTSLLSVLRARLNTIETFESLILDEQTYELKTEKSVHRILEKSMWLLNDEYWIAQSNKSLRTFIGRELDKGDKTHSAKRPDFACVDTMSRIVIVEIKRPSLELKKAEIDQAELYLRLIGKYSGSTPKIKPVVYLVGHKVSSEARELAEMRGYPRLLTYQDMVGNARKRYQEYLRIVERPD